MRVRNRAVVFTFIMAMSIFTVTSCGGGGNSGNYPLSSPSSENPSLVWTGTEYGLSWSDSRNDLDGICDTSDGTMDCNYEIYFARIDSSGNKIGSDVKITNDPSYSENPSLVWTGTGYGVSWEYYLGALSWAIYFTLFTP